jgi:hypothetical protein
MSISNAQIKQLFDSLARSWHVERIVDGSTAVSGVASFKSNQSDEMLYQERGLVKLSDGKQLFARQSYIYKFDAGSISVYFDEEPQRLFHHIEFVFDADGILRGRGSHQCKEDLYQIAYCFFIGSDPPSFQIEYKVDGPSKHSTILCSYQAQIEGSKNSLETLAPTIFAQHRCVNLSRDQK